MPQKPENHVIGRGDVYFAKRNAAGVLGLFVPIGNTPAFSVSASSESIKHYSSARQVKVQDREVMTQVTNEGKFSTDNVNAANLAAFLLGENTTLTVAGSLAIVETFIAEPRASYQVGISNTNPTGRRNIANVAVKVGVAVKVLGTDYNLIAERGLVEVIQGGTIASGATVEVTYDQVAHSIERTVSGANAVKGAVMFVAYNSEGEDTDYRMMDCQISPDGEFAIKTDEWQQLPFKLMINTPTNGYAIVADGQPFTV